MTRRQQLGPARADVDDLFCVLRDNLGKADAFISTAEELIERPQSPGGEEESDDDVVRCRNHIEYLVEAAKISVRAAAYTVGEIEKITQRRREL